MVNFEQLDAMAGLQRLKSSREQTQLLEEQNRLLNNQQREFNRIAALPKCPECKQPLDNEPNVCPHCRHRLTWLELSDDTYIISEHSLSDNLELMYMARGLGAEEARKVAQKNIAKLGKSFERMPHQIKQLSTLRVSNPKLFKDRFISALIKRETLPSVFKLVGNSLGWMLFALFLFGFGTFGFRSFDIRDDEQELRIIIAVGVFVLFFIPGILCLFGSASRFVKSAGILWKKMLLKRANQLDLHVLLSTLNSIQAGVAEINTSLSNLRCLANDMRKIRSTAIGNDIRLDSLSKDESYQPHKYEIKGVNLTRDSSDWAIDILANELQASQQDLVYFSGYLAGRQRNSIPNRQVDIQKNPEYWIKRNDQTIGPFSRGKLAKFLRAKTEPAAKLKFPCIKCRAILVVSSERLGSIISCQKCKQRQKLPASTPSISDPDLISKSRNGPWSKLTQELIEKLT